MIPAITSNKNLTPYDIEQLKKYDASIYYRPSFSVDDLIFTVSEQESENYRKLSDKSLRILMVKRGEWPHKDLWALPGGFLKEGESIDQAANNILRTKTNIKDIYMEQLYTWGDPARDFRTQVISCSYIALVKGSTHELKAGDGIAEAAWFDIGFKVCRESKTALETGFAFEKDIELTLTHEDTVLSANIRISEIREGRASTISRATLEKTGIAFDHEIMIEYAIERLRNKIEFTDIAFNLMPEEFTLSHIQQVYEVILNRELLAPAFRRKIAAMVTETKNFTSDAGHRPSKLYKFNSNWKGEQ